MVNRTALAVLLLAFAAPSRATDTALRQANGIANGGSLGAYDGGCTGGSCGVQPALCSGEGCRIDRASGEALQTGGLVVTDGRGARPNMVAEVPAPSLTADKPGDKDKPGFFKKLFSGKGLLYGLGGAAAGAGIGWLVGGPIGAVIGGLLGAVGGFFLSKMLAK